MTHPRSIRDECARKAVAVFRGGSLELYVTIGIFAILLLGLAVWVAIQSGNWTAFACVQGPFVILLLILRYLKLEIREDGFRYRNLSMNRAVPFAEVQRAYFETLRDAAVPQGVPVFWVQVRNQKKPMKINLLTFSTRAVAFLFAAFERHGIEIEAPGAWAVQSLLRKVRKEQSKWESERSLGARKGHSPD